MVLTITEAIGIVISFQQSELLECAKHHAMTDGILLLWEKGTILASCRKSSSSYNDFLRFTRFSQK